jgi:hypothetical protein
MGTFTLMRGVHFSGTEGRGRVVDQYDLTARLHAVPVCRLDAAAGHQADD